MEAKDALDRGDPVECITLLDRAKQEDSAGDDTPDVKALRKRALDVLHGNKTRVP